MAVDYSDVAEVVTCSRRKVNGYLEAGYRLLAVEQETLWAKPPKGVQSIEGYVLKHLTFVVGRPEGVEAFDPGKGS